MGKANYSDNIKIAFSAYTQMLTVQSYNQFISTCEDEGLHGRRVFTDLKRQHKRVKQKTIFNKLLSLLKRKTPNQNNANQSIKSNSLKQSSLFLL